MKGILLLVYQCPPKAERGSLAALTVSFTYCLLQVLVLWFQFVSGPTVAIQRYLSELPRSSKQTKKRRISLDIEPLLNTNARFFCSCTIWATEYTARSTPTFLTPPTIIQFYKMCLNLTEVFALPTVSSCQKNLSWHFHWFIHTIQNCFNSSGHKIDQFPGFNTNYTYINWFNYNKSQNLILLASFSLSTYSKLN